jgi:hypothetical protein
MYTSDFGKICFQLLLHEIEYLTYERFMVYIHIITSDAFFRDTVSNQLHVSGEEISCQTKLVI